MSGASHQTSMEAEARAILAQALEAPESIAPPRTPEEMRARLEAVRGTWKQRYEGKTTDDVMKELRGDD